MKILYFYHLYDRRTKERGAEMEALGHKVRYSKIKRKKEKGKISLNQLKGVDLIWTLSSHYNYFGAIDEAFIKASKKRDIPWVTYTTIDTLIPLKEWIKSYDIYDYVFIHNKELVEKINQPKIRYMPIGVYTHQFYPLKRKQKYQVSFVGSPQSNLSPEEDLRCQVLEAVTQNYDLTIFGKAFRQRISNVPIHRFQSIRKQRNVFNSTLINLDMPFINSSVPEYRRMTHLKNRFFEIPACKSFMLSGRSAEAESIFKDGIHCVYYDSTSDLLDKIDYYVKNPEEAKKIGERGYVEAITNNTYRDRFKKMFNIIENL